MWFRLKEFPSRAKKKAQKTVIKLDNVQDISKRPKKLIWGRFKERIWYFKDLGEVESKLIRRRRNFLINFVLFEVSKPCERKKSFSSPNFHIQRVICLIKNYFRHHLTNYKLPEKKISLVWTLFKLRQLFNCSEKFIMLFLKSIFSFCPFISLYHDLLKDNQIRFFIFNESISWII